MMFGAGALINIGLTAARAKVLVEAGAAANGYLQTVTSMSAYILSFVTSGFYGHLHARAAAAGDTPEVREELNKALRLALIMIFTGCGAAAMLAEYIIPLFFSGEFRPAADLMIAYMPGELCYQLLVLLMGYQLTISRRRRYLAWGLGYIGMMTAIAMIAIPELGAAGYVLAHVAASLLMLCVATFISYRTGQVTASMVGSIAALAILLALMAAMLLYPPGGLRWLAQLILLVPVALTGVVTLKALFARQKEA
jgi:O-antigen/teichoic acid export membrane protein